MPSSWAVLGVSLCNWKGVRARRRKRRRRRTVFLNHRIKQLGINIGIAPPMRESIKPISHGGGGDNLAPPPLAELLNALNFAD